jgi:hypothetical protein
LGQHRVLFKNYKNFLNHAKRGKKENVMEEKELERQNFLTWCKYATFEELEKAKSTNKRTLERLLYKYADEIEKTSNSKYVSEYMSQNNIGVQKLELSLEIWK